MRQITAAEMASLFAAVSNQMHQSLDIPVIMRAGVAAAMAMSGARAGAAGLMMQEHLAFNEFCSGGEWFPLQGRFDADEGIIGSLITRHETMILDDLNHHPGFEDLGTVTQLLAVPVTGKDKQLLGCLLMFDREEGSFDDDICRLLEQLASMMSSAIEVALQMAASNRTEADLERSVATYRTLVEQIPAITYIATLDRSRILFVSPQVKDILGFHQDEFLANQHIWSERIHPGDRDAVIAEVRRSIEEKVPFHMECRMTSKDGSERWVKDAATIVRDQDRDIYLPGVVYDISASKEAEHKLRHLAHFDQLTGLANRTLFHDRLHQTVVHAKRHGQRFAMIYMDLDGFKAVNDNLGHEAGDLLLKEAAERLRSNVRESDTVARMGGDEFTIILDDVKEMEGTAFVAQKLVDAISEPYEHIEGYYPVTLSMGIAFYPDDHIEPDVLVTMADNAMCRAKARGKNCYCFHRPEVILRSGTDQ